MLSSEGPKYRFSEIQRDPSTLSRKQILNLALASLGSVLEWYEFIVFGFFTLVIARQFFPPEMPEALRVAQTLVIFSIGSLLRPISGAVVGHLGDRFGRKKLFLLTVLGMALATLAIGLLPTYAQIGVAAPILLLVLRIVQGMAIAGEFAGAAVFVAEHVPRTRVGAAIGPMMAGTYSGYFLGSAVGALIVAYLDQASVDAWGWRVAFIAGGLFGLLAVYLRRSLDETPLFKEISSGTAQPIRAPLSSLLRDYWRRVLIVAGAGAFLGSTIITIYFYTPALLQSRYHVPASVASNAIPPALLLLAAMCVLWGRVSDRIGPGLVLCIGAVGLVSTTTYFYLHVETIAQQPSQLVYWFLGFTVWMGTVVAVPIIGTSIFPTNVRFSGFGLSYNIGSVLSNLTPALLGWVVLRYGDLSVAYYAGGIGILGILMGVCATAVLSSRPLLENVAAISRSRGA